MGFLDDDPEYVPRFTPKPRKYRYQSPDTQEERDSELNNHDREDDCDTIK